MSSKKIIYKKRFEKDWLLTSDKKEFTSEEFEAAYRKIAELEKLFNEKSSYIKINRSSIVFNSYIELAKKLADVLEADIDIIKEKDYYKVILYIGYIPIFRDGKNLLSFMFMTCDEAYISAPSDLETYYEYKIEFILYTHELYVDGKPVALHEPLV